MTTFNCRQINILPSRTVSKSLALSDQLIFATFATPFTSVTADMLLSSEVTSAISHGMSDGTLYHTIASSGHSVTRIKRDSSSEQNLRAVVMLQAYSLHRRACHACSRPNLQGTNPSLCLSSCRVLPTAPQQSGHLPRGCLSRSHSKSR